ncbi:MAG: ABC transporter ATP-binding protein [Lawsonella sp.]
MTTSATAPAAAAHNITKIYGEGETEVRALDGVSVSFKRGEFTAIMGPSGSGKSTLMHCLAGLDSVTSGKVSVGNIDITSLNDERLTQLRRERIGFIFQSFNLIPTLSAAENITLPIDIAGHKLDQEWMDEVVKKMRIDNRLDHKPSELSGGQQQRVACARAIVSRPDIIFGDEPTGNLDSNSSRDMLQILRSAVDDWGQTVVIVTHDAKAAAYANRVLFLSDGQIVHELENTDNPRESRDAILDVMMNLEN